MGLLDGKAAIVTGSARGIGRATAELFINEGAKVLINDIDGDVAEQAASEIDGETAVFAGDLTEPGVPDELVAKAVEAFGEVDIIVNNAGYTWDGVVHRMTDEQFQAMLDIHTIVPFRVVRAIAPHWREAAKAERAEGVERFRKIVNISSISGTMGNAGQVNYSAAKAGVVGFTKTLAKEWGSFKINCNAVAFGFIETRLTQAKEKGETLEVGDGETGRARDPRADARDGLGDHPARPARPARGGRGAGALPQLRALQLRSRSMPERHRRPVRRYVHVGLVALVAAAVAVGGCGSSADDPEQEPVSDADATAVAALGDSITSGSPGYDPDPAQRAAFGFGDDERSQYEYWAESARPGLEFTNCGVFGERTDEIAQRLDGCAEGADDPDRPGRHQRHRPGASGRRRRRRPAVDGRPRQATRP